ncbi:MAG: aldo/keto reductase, partial [Nitrospirae bacterium]|nr:aldo/keto reductase [Nitrospirota bacterium]
IISVDGIKESTYHSIRINGDFNKLISNLKILKEISRSYGCSFAPFVTAWTIAQPGITTAIIGTTKPQHIKEAVDGTKITINSDDTLTIRNIINDNQQV